jgi:hypothetical protein
MAVVAETAGTKEISIIKDIETARTPTLTPSLGNLVPFDGPTLGVWSP